MSDTITFGAASKMELQLADLAARVGQPSIEGDDFFHQLMNSLPAAIYITDPEGRITYFNEAAAALWGYRPELGKSEWCGSWKLFWPDGRVLPHAQCPMAIAVKERRAVRGMEAVAERPDGTRIPFIPFPTPIYSATGELIGAVNMLVDIAERKSAEETAQRLASIVESSDDAIISKDLNGVITSWNKGAERLFGYMPEEIVGKSITILIPPEHLSEENTIIERIRRGQRIEHYETVRQRKHGSLINISLTVSPIKNAAGKIIGASKIARDITERKRAEAQISTLAREAEHRAKNMLANVQATVRLSHSDTPEGLKQTIEGRIQALSNVHRLFVQSRWAGADLHSLVSEELSPYCQQGEKRASIEGPTLLLKPDVAQAIAVTLHELTTNAAKYGAMSVPEGRVQIGWSQAPDGCVTLRWIESGGPPVKLPQRQGFGTRVMASMIQGHLAGEMNFDWRSSGLVCEIRVDGGVAAQ
jgi:two-component system CheB/CheR fusion protein